MGCVRRVLVPAVSACPVCGGSWCDPQQRRQSRGSEETSRSAAQPDTHAGDTPASLPSAEHWAACEQRQHTVTLGQPGRNNGNSQGRRSTTSTRTEHSGTRAIRPRSHRCSNVLHHERGIGVHGQSHRRFPSISHVSRNVLVWLSLVAAREEQDFEPAKPWQASVPARTWGSSRVFGRWLSLRSSLVSLVPRVLPVPVYVAFRVAGPLRLCPNHCSPHRPMAKATAHRTAERADDDTTDTRAEKTRRRIAERSPRATHQSSAPTAPCTPLCGLQTAHFPRCSPLHTPTHQSTAMSTANHDGDEGCLQSHAHTQDWRNRDKVHEEKQHLAQPSSPVSLPPRTRV